MDNDARSMEELQKSYSKLVEILFRRVDFKDDESVTISHSSKYALNSFLSMGELRGVFILAGTGLAHLQRSGPIDSEMTEVIRQLMRYSMLDHEEKPIDYSVLTDTEQSIISKEQYARLLEWIKKT